MKDKHNTQLRPWVFFPLKDRYNRALGSNRWRKDEVSSMTSTNFHSFPRQHPCGLPDTPADTPGILEHLRPGSLTIFHFNFHWSTVAFQCCASFSPSKVNQPHVYTHPLPFGRSPVRSPQCVGQRPPSVQHALSMFSQRAYSMLIHTINSLYVRSQSPSSSHPCLPPLISIHSFSRSASLFLLCKWDYLYHFSSLHVYAFDGFHEDRNQPM